ncbi:hypothetical protein Naga_101987g1 [Nannochloropsis gaditana]|uniref:Uncharacterized protein n=1 Tax=Nannochloropsis gaditana TaxID=72520 RepID=W7TNU6_9STRA|nr:hypothetical protein Naga_101987g1 [Nannochloropsis gaditana]
MRRRKRGSRGRRDDDLSFFEVSINWGEGRVNRSTPPPRRWTFPVTGSGHSTFSSSSVAATTCWPRI